MKGLVSRVTTSWDFIRVDQNFEGISITSIFYPEFGGSELLPQLCIICAKLLSKNDYLDSYLWNEI
jgi:hypothetical protein